MEKERNRGVKTTFEMCNRPDDIERNLLMEGWHPIPKVKVRCYLEVLVFCPYCGDHKDISDNDSIREEINRGAEDIEVNIKCSECNKEFIVERVDF